MEKTFDNPEAVIKSFIQFEREEGSLEAFDQAKKLCKIKMDKVRASREKENAAKEEEDRHKQEKIEKKKEKDKQFRRDKRQQLAADKKASAQDLCCNECYSSRGDVFYLNKTLLNHI